MKVVKFFLLTVLFSLLCGCNSGKKDELQRNMTLAGSIWIPVDGPQGAYLEFSGDMLRIIGSTGGNRYFAPVEKSQNNLINFGAIASTRAMSRDPEKEAVFLDALDRTRAWKIEDNMLILENERRNELLKLYRAQRTVPVRRDK